MDVQLGPTMGEECALDVTEAARHAMGRVMPTASTAQ